MTTTFRPALLAIVAAALLVQGAAAQPPVGRDPGDRLRRADADGDGRVTRDEFIKARSSDLEAAFARLDADGNGAIDDEEMAAAAERMRSAGGRFLLTARAAFTRCRPLSTSMWSSVNT